MGSLAELMPDCNTPGFYGDLPRLWSTLGWGGLEDAW